MIQKDSSKKEGLCQGRSLLENPRSECTTGFSSGLSVAIAVFSILLTNFAFGEVLILQTTDIPSKQSMIGDKYTFPALIENSVISVNHFWFGRFSSLG